MKALIILIINLLPISVVFSAVSLQGTRVIFSNGEKEKTLYLQNHGENSSLIQIWADNGNEKSTIENEDHHFLITPHIFKMHGNTHQSVRLIFLESHNMPTDRESLFFLNFIEIPMAKKNSLHQNQLSLLLRNRIKIFYRPKGLIGNTAESIHKLIFELEKNKNYFLIIKNPTEYYINFNEIKIGSSNQYIMVNSQNYIVPPKSSVKWEALNNLNLNHISEVKFSTINDHGAIIEHQTKIN